MTLRSTKIKLTNQNVEQTSGSTLTLSGNTQIGSTGNLGTINSYTITKAITTGATRFDFSFPNTVSDYDYIWSWADGQIIPVAFSNKNLTGITVTPEADGLLTIRVYSK